MMKFKNQVKDSLLLSIQGDEPELQLLVSGKEFTDLSNGRGFALFKVGGSINNLELASETMVYSNDRPPRLPHPFYLRNMLQMLLEDGIAIICIDNGNTYKLDISTPFTNKDMSPITELPKSEFTDDNMYKYHAIDTVELTANGWTELVPEMTQPVSCDISILKEINNG